MFPFHKLVFRFGVVRLGVVLLAAGAVAASLALFAQNAAVPGTGVAQPAAAASQRSAFEVAAIRPNHSGSRGGNLRWTGDRFTAINMRLNNLIEFAYQVREFQLSGGPAWISSDGYDIDAKAGDSLVKLPGSEQLAQKRLMLQSLLADRFHLVLRQETKTLPVYKLVITKGGPKLGAATGRSGWSTGNGEIKAQAITMATFADMLSSELERNVVDETHLSGRYDMSLRWSPDNGAAPPPGTSAAGAQPAAQQPDTTAASIYTAIQEQLGLKLEAAKAPVETLVIVHVERPSEN